MTLNLKFKHLSSVEDILETLPLINQLYPKITKDEFRESIAQMIEDSNYKMLAAFDGERLVGVAGYWILRMLYCKKYLQISNFVVDQNCRSQGIGGLILNYLEQYAKDQECDVFALDSYVENKKAHALFLKKDFYIRGLHFIKDLKS